MTKEPITKEPKQTMSDGALPKVDYERLMALSSANVEAFMKTSEAMLKGVTKLNEELVSFTANRLKERVEGNRAIAQCGNWNEAVEQQMNLARSATEQYLAEASKLASLAAEVTIASWAPLQSYLQTSLGEIGKQPKKS